MRVLYPSFIWEMPVNDRTIYLSFDDGPHPEITPFVLDQLKDYNAKASFFCIGENIVKYPSVYERIVNEGHAMGNHTYNHLNGWKTANEEYLKMWVGQQLILIANCFARLMERLKDSRQDTTGKQTDMKIIMWSVLSGDFDQRILPEKCLENVITTSRRVL